MKKKSTMVLSFALGTILFASTAFAEVNVKSGYVQLKDALKYAADSCSSKLNSYTVDMSIIMKDNGNTIYSDNELLKYDVTKGAKENKSIKIDASKAKQEGYLYSDKDGSITLDSRQDVYYVNKLKVQSSGANFTNPFKDKQAVDMEKIVDSIIGNLKDSVVVTENKDGTKQLSGTLSEAQIPALANALVSYGLKNSLANPYKTSNIGTDPTVILPKIVDDIYVKEIKGNMTLNKDGLIQSAMGTGALSGIDKQGKKHNLTYEQLVKISDVNKTIVNKPDLTGKKVQVNVQKDNNTITNPKMFIGTYKNDIIIVKDGKFQKIGERIAVISHLDDKNISGRYHEEYIKGNEEYSKKAKDFKFDTKLANQLNATFHSTDSLGNKIDGNIWTNPKSAEIGISIEGPVDPDMSNTCQYSRVFN